MAFDSLSAVSRTLLNLDYTEVKLTWAQLEKNLTIVAPAERGLPDFYLTVPGHGRGKGLPMTRVAASQFGRLSGVKQAIYREFSHDPTLTESMVSYSMGHRDIPHVLVCHTGTQIVGVYAAEKPWFSLTELFDQLQTAPGAAYADFRLTPEGSFEFLLLGGRDRETVRPGLYLQYAGRPVVATCSALHDFSLVIGSPMPAKKKKHKAACVPLLGKHVEDRMNLALQEAGSIAELPNHPLSDPARFLTRLSELHGFSSQSAETLIAGALATLVTGSSQYEATRYVASLAVSAEAKAPAVDRRFQRFAHVVAFTSGVCSHCGLPH